MNRATIRADRPASATVPFVDLRPMTERVRAAVLEELADVMDTGDFVNGRAVAAFEEAFADATGAAHVVGVASGLDALRLALDAMELAPGDEVLVPAMTFVATFEAVAQVGAVPVPVDVREDDCALDPEAAEGAVTQRTRGVLPVHLYGQMADVAALAGIADRHGLRLLEDACQAHGAERAGIRPAQRSDGAAYSFYPSKNLGAMGDAGALVTSDAELARRARALREHGETTRYRSEYIGYTARLDTFQAVVLRHKLPYLDEWNAQRREAARQYASALDGIGDLRLPAVLPDAVHVWHLYTVRTADPEALAGHLRERGIGTGRHYPEAPHLSRAFAHLGHPAGSFPVAEAIAAETLSLPLYPGIGEAQIELVALAIADYFERG